MQATDTSDTRTRLLEQARIVYLEGGAAHFSLREVARRVGVSAPAVYRHFDSKEALLSSVCAEGFQTFASYLIKALTAKTPMQRLRATGEHYARFALAHPHDYRFIFMSGLQELMVSAAPLSREQSPTFQFLVDRIRECIEAKKIARGDPQALAVTVWAHVHGLASLRLSGHLESVGDEEAFLQFFQSSLDHLLAGLAP